MSKNLKKLLEAVSTDPAALARFGTLTKHELIALAKEYGIALTEADLAPVEGEISDDELETVAGGKNCSCNFAGSGKSSSYYGSASCSCEVGGVGSMDDGTSRCLCVLEGIGEDERIHF